MAGKEGLMDIVPWFFREIEAVAEPKVVFRAN
jgi:hypothetical protein